MRKGLGRGQALTTPRRVEPSRLVVHQPVDAVSAKAGAVVILVRQLVTCCVVCVLAPDSGRVLVRQSVALQVTCVLVPESGRVLERQHVASRVTGVLVPESGRALVRQLSAL